MAKRRTSGDKTKDLFREAGVAPVPSGPVECLGMTFDDDDARRAYFLEKLREKLKDPEFRKIEGFPIGTDEDILALSDPPYYTACPNPFLADFIGRLDKSRLAEEVTYHREPLTDDLSESRNDVIYTAHTYHTKVPPRAIAQYILHFTNPGDIVLDAFAGSGMTGVACLLCADPSIARSPQRPGLRRVVLCDLAPVATFVAATYLSPPDPDTFADKSEELLDHAEDLVGPLWLYEEKGKSYRIEFQVWAEVFTCPACQQSIESVAVVAATEEIGSAKEFPCPHCQALVSKAPTKKSGSSRLERRLRSRFDSALAKTIKYLPRAAMLTNILSRDQRRCVTTSEAERDRLSRMDYCSDFWFPTDPLVEGERFSWKDCLPSYGITHIHHFYMPRQLRTYSCLWHLAMQEGNRKIRNALAFFLQTNALGMTVLNRFGPTHYSQVNKYFSGTLYIPSTIVETSHRYTYTHKRKRLVTAFSLLRNIGHVEFAITTQSSTSLASLPDASVDYIFVDPPFGRNLQYSELNQIWEAWLKVRTNRAPEVVIDSTRNRGAFEYTTLMLAVFREMCRVLKPGRWITVVFHNSSNAVWLAIQEALMGAGFVVADVRTLDKRRETYKQNRQGLVKKDLVISGYRPPTDLEERFRLEAGTSEGVWDFVRNHLEQLPVFVGRDSSVEIVGERQSYMLFDRMVAFHVERGVTVPMSASEFYAGLIQRFPEREDMFFLPEQVAEYDKKRMTVKEVAQLELIPRDEESAIQWLRQQLRERPRTAAELTPEFMKAIGGWLEHEKPLELRELLEQNFLCYDGKGEVPSQIHSYLSSNFKDARKIAKDDPGLRAKAKDRWYVPDPNKAGDLEKLRERALLKEFWEYLPPGYTPARPDSQEGFIPGLEPKPAPIPKGKKMKVIRLEAVRAGFKYCWQNRDYRTIIAVAERIPEDVLQEDPKLLMWYDQALTRTAE